MTKKEKLNSPLKLNDTDRNLAPDLGRGFMLLLIVIAHAPFYLYTAGPGIISRPFGESLIDHIVNFIGVLFVDSRSFPMFAALFGYGLAFMVKKRTEKGVAEELIKKSLRRRSWFLLLFGFIHFVFIGGADILGLYGFSGLLISWLLFSSGKIQLRTLIIVGVAYFIIIPVSWFMLIMTSGGASMQVGLTAEHTYFGLVIEHTMAFPFVILVQLSMYPMLLAILIGVWVAGKQWLDQPYRFRQTLKRIAIWGLMISVVGGFPLALVSVQLWEPSLEVLSLSVILHIITGLAGGFAYTAIIALISINARNKIPKTAWFLSAVGKRSLTFYLYQEALLVVLLSPVAFGLGSEFDATGVFILAILIWISGVLLASWLENRKWPGPADALLRRLIYRK
ncbi:DUF418 domain-containing protein [Bacillus horti]|uniref:Membrane protein YeiB n=1 Tax=Caldalkalibacillus horti TaxID=77523 RepID=A0ABT9VWI0_9BACI|nr:DUF418 domain-containing protein [Bacillus horti]MDQ0165353.1 putative membrane protein YeiB [Bacillus horti]